MRKTLPTRAPTLALILLLAACQGSAPAPDAAGSDEAVAMVERAQHVQPPVQPLHLGPVSFADIRDPAADLHMPHDLGNPHEGDGCSFLDAGDRRPVLVIEPKAGLIHDAGGWEMFAADSGSDTMPDGLHVAYSSAKHTMRLFPAAGGRVAVTVRDIYDRVVWQATGEMRCKA